MPDTKLTALTAYTPPVTGDIMYVVAAPGSSPASKKMTVDNLFKGVLQTIGLGIVGDSSNRGWIVFNKVRSGNTPFAMGTGGSFFSGGPDGSQTWDDVLTIAAFNADPTTAGNTLDSTKPRMTLTMEQSYWNGTYLTAEYNFAFQNTAAKNTYGVRPMEFAVDMDNSVSDATSVMSWQFRMGKAAGSFMRFGTPSNPQIVQIYPDNSVDLGYDGTESIRVSAAQSGGNTIGNITLAGTHGNPYFAFGYPIGVGGVNPSNLYDIYAANNVKVGNNLIPSNIIGPGTGTSGFLMTDTFNYGNYVLGFAGLSGTPIRIRMDFGGTPYFFLVYPTAA